MQVINIDHQSEILDLITMSSLSDEILVIVHHNKIYLTFSGYIIDSVIFYLLTIKQARSEIFDVESIARHASDLHNLVNLKMPEFKVWWKGLQGELLKLNTAYNSNLPILNDDCKNMCASYNDFYCGIAYYLMTLHAKG